MGLLTEGQPLTWEETKQLADHVRQHGIDQFVNLYHQLLDRKGDILKWGDEVIKWRLNRTISPLKHSIRPPSTRSNT